VANNAVGNVVDPDSGAFLAAPRDDAPGSFVRLADSLERRTAMFDALLENTSLICVATNAKLEHGSLERIAYHAHDGLARTIVPAHTAGDGDTAFVVTTGEVEVATYDGLTAGALAARAVELAVLRSIEHATDIAGIPSAKSWIASRPTRGRART
jgi:L-aminopeptidase/D-esterase-like protein